MRLNGTEKCFPTIKLVGTERDEAGSGKKKIRLGEQKRKEIFEQKKGKKEPRKKGKK